MTDSGDVDPGQKPFKSIIEVPRAAGELASRLALSADWWGDASTEARKEVNSELDGTELQEDWPLSTFRLTSLFESAVSGGLKGVMSDESKPHSFLLETGHVNADTLLKAYKIL